MKVLMESNNLSALNLTSAGFRVGDCKKKKKEKKNPPLHFICKAEGPSTPSNSH